MISRIFGALFSWWDRLRGLHRLAKPQSPQMTSPDLALPSARLSPSETLSDLLDAAGIGKGDTIRITGHGALAVLLWFCRHGYEQVGYVSVGPGPNDGGDLLIVPQTCDIEDLADILRRGPHPRDGGVLIVQTAATQAAGEDLVRTLLGAAGYRLEHSVHGRHREVHVARRVGRTSGRLAA
jgi:hypothetical protein